MANSLENKLVVSDLDFDTIKQNLKNFMRSQSEFSDYDFEGSALSNLIDILAYNTHYMAFYANMLANEAFLDTASIRESVVSHAKMLGYTPSSTKSALANVTLTFTQANNAALVNFTSLTIPKFTKFASSAIDGVNYIFTNLEEKTVTKSNNAFTFANLNITEGTPVNYVYTYDQLNNPLQEFDIPDANADTSHLVVVVQNSNVDISQTTFTLATKATEVSSTAPVFYLDETKGGKYKIYFGDGIIGKQLTDGNVVVISYILSKGPAANKAKNFALMDTVQGLSSGTVITNNAAAGGADAESNDRIKYTAPKAYVSNNRAVTKNDYIALIQQNYPSLSAVNVWGGEENSPPIYGKVYICAKPADGFQLTTTEKQYIIDNIISPLSILTVTPQFVDPDYNYLNLAVNVTYDPTATSQTNGQIETAVRNTIYAYAQANLNGFDSYFKLSRMMREIDNIDSAIMSNQIDISLEKRLEPVLGTSRNYFVNFFTSLKRSTGKNRLNSYPPYTAFDAEDNLRSFFLEEVPLSFTGISKVNVVFGGSGFSNTPTLAVEGDGIGAKVTAIVTNGKITSVNIDNQGSEYSTATIVAYDIDGKVIDGLVFEVLVENKIGTIRSYYFDDNRIKTIYSTNAGTIDYENGIVKLLNFTPLDILNDLKVLKLFAVPENTLFSSSKNSIITIDTEDTAAVTVNTIKVK